MPSCRRRAPCTDPGPRASGRYHHSCRTQDRAARPVALLDDVEDDPRVGALLLAGGEGRVALGIERVAGWVELLDPLALERGHELAVHHPYALGEMLLALAGRAERALEVVDDRQELAHEVRLRALAGLRGVAGRPLAEIVELRA